MATSAQYAATPNTFFGTIAAGSGNVTTRANATPANLVTIVAAAGTGTRIDSIAFHAQGGAADATANTACNLYLYIGSSAAAAKCFQEIQVGVVTPSKILPSWSASLSNMGLILESGNTLFAAVSQDPTVAIDFVGTMAGDL